jgi:hypothetical protein
MTTEEFYARALLAAFPIADAALPSTQSKTIKGIASLAHEYAGALTDVYKSNRRSFHEES